jgi:epoxyqueuosine reductase
VQKRIEEILKQNLVPRSNFIFGMADLTGLLDGGFGDFRYAISIGKKLDDSIVSGIKGGPTLEYYAHYRSMNTDLSELSQKIAGDLRKAGNEIRLIDPSVTTDQLDTVYATTLRTPLSHKMAATVAGLGWIGKTDLFISKKFGPRLRLVTILTSTPLTGMLSPIKKSRCGACNICVEACPAKAANGKLWDVSVDRDEFFDAFKCRKQCAEFGRTRLSMDARVCGVCVAVCPVGQEVTSYQ